jgi:hypothetical protein
MRIGYIHFVPVATGQPVLRNKCVAQNECGDWPESRLLPRKKTSPNFVVIKSSTPCKGILYIDVKIVNEKVTLEPDFQKILLKEACDMP